MKIRFLTGPKAGQTEHVENNSQTQLLISLGHIEIVTETTKPLPASFGVILGVRNAGATLQAFCPTCQRTEFYVGRPDKQSIAEGFLPYLCTHFKGVEVPEDVRLRYLKSWVPTTLAGPGQRSFNPPSATTERHVAEVDGVLMPVPAPKGWIKVERG